MQLKTLLKHPAINEWRLLGCITLVMSLAVIGTASGLDLSRAESVSAMIAYSVRWSVPWLYLAFAASSLQQLVGNDLSRWLLRNRKIMGLSFATGMTWQVSFILWLVIGHSDYYVNEVYVLRDAIEGLVGYALLIAMTVTTFKFARSAMKPKHWKTLHRWGIYYLWAYAFSVYWHELFYYKEPDWVDYCYYLGGALSLLLRITAWSKKQLQQAEKQGRLAEASSVPWSGLGAMLVVAGLLAAVMGLWWADMAYLYFWDVSSFSWLELYMPYWPFIPYLPMFLVLAGVALRVRGQTLRVH
ncbi:MAG: hypothetical protein V7754_06735 [Halioglobus sp.]